MRGLLDLQGWGDVGTVVGGGASDVILAAPSDAKPLAVCCPTPTLHVSQPVFERLAFVYIYVQSVLYIYCTSICNSWLKAGIVGGENCARYERVGMRVTTVPRKKATNETASWRLGTRCTCTGVFFVYLRRSRKEP